jgi:hypothetical protein
MKQPFGKQWAKILWEAGARKNWKGFRIPSFKLTERNAIRHPDARRNDKSADIPKHFRSYQKRYQSVDL